MDVHQCILLSFDEPGVLKPNELEAAVMAAQATYDSMPLIGTVAGTAAAYVHYLNRSHVFEDGNKRTALFAAIAFLEYNGFVDVIDFRKWRQVMIEHAEQRVSQAELAQLFAEALGGDPIKIEY